MNKTLFLAIVLFGILTAGGSYAQNRGQENSREAGSDRGGTYDPQLSKQKKKSKGKKYLAGEYDKKVEEHNKLMEENAKKNEKAAKEMEKPQYSDPTYFGHKHPPKKRPPGKKKFCKVCGMVH